MCICDVAKRIRDRGIAEGEAKGEAKGKIEGKIEVAMKMLQKKFPEETILSLGITLEQLQKAKDLLSI